MGDWRERTVLVTGGAGFIGSHLARRLVSAGAQASVVDNLSRGSPENLDEARRAVRFIKGDLTDQQTCLEACRGAQVVFHLASRVGGIQYYLSKPGEVITHNVLIDSLVIRAALACGVERFVYASSAHVYPLERQLTPDAPALREDQALPANPPLSYGWAKLLAEQQLLCLREEGAPMRSAILRLAGVYGEYQDPDLATGSAIPVFVRRAIDYPERRPFVVLGSGREVRSYCYIDDVVDALLLAAEKLEEGDSLGPLNVGSEQRVCIQDLAREVIEVSGKEIEIENDPGHGTHIWAQVPDCSLARQQLGWAPRVPLREGLTKVYRHMQQRLPVPVREGA